MRPAGARRLEVALETGEDVVGHPGGLAPSSPKKMTPIRATPMAPPICWTVVSTPEAEPASWPLMPASTTLTSRATTLPSPRPQTSRAGMSCQELDRAAVAVDRPHERDHAGDQQQRAGAEDPPAQGRGQADRRRRGQGRPDRERGPGEAGVQGAEPEADLEPQREGEEERGDAHEEDAGHGRPGDERPLAEQVEVDQRRPVRRFLCRS